MGEMHSKSSYLYLSLRLDFFNPNQWMMRAINQALILHKYLLGAGKVRTHEDEVTTFSLSQKLVYLEYLPLYAWKARDSPLCTKIELKR